MNPIVHITHRNVWERAASTGYYRPPSFDSDGFIHCSTIEQAAETANHYFAGQRNLVILCIDADGTEAEVRFEGPVGGSDPRASSLFPHLHGPLNVSAVVRVVNLDPDAQGRFELPAEVRAWAEGNGR